ncbi:SPOR domain-containing protein [Thioclava pacifica]|uniref:SPOR domain-containing protein n=1 Tax=Thioclava pacifica DSM 10166 TaxID=1353537 RepID=A0A074JMC3_9RHOB|nr:SPOR domain-containing protein [Thioclava pacifica]KEO50557.1 hypothetical protein TP2_14925 [Thioclava pacifica DSM 10166]
MRFDGGFSAAILAAVFGAGTGLFATVAQAEDYAPAETPPSSFQGRQYVDSNGCVFIRAGYGEAVKWVPRINRDRTPVCGYKPTFPSAELAAAPSAAPAPAPAPALTPAAPKPTPMRTVSAPAPTPAPRANAPMETVASKMMPAPSATNSPYYPVAQSAPTVLASATSAPATSGYVSPFSATGDAAPGGSYSVNVPVAPSAPQANPAPATSGDCAGLDPLAQQLMMTREGMSVRCGPQQISPTSGYVVPGATTVVAAPAARQIPREVSVGGLAPVVTTSKAPDGGWRPAFDDGRLNPYRGPRTTYGDAQMAQRWGDGVPMEMPKPPASRVIYVPVAPTQATMSSKSVAPAKTVTRQGAVAGKRFVQVGSFGVPANAEAAKARLRALGLPVATGKSGRLTVIYAGPFASSAALQQALASAKGAGFSDAILR